MRRIAAELALPELGFSRRLFDKAARTFASAAFVHDEARRRLLERVDDLKIEPGVVVDLGAALGQGTTALTRRFAGAHVIALDSSERMLKRIPGDSNARVLGEASKLPLADASVELLFANMLLPWARPDAVFAEARRVLTATGVLVFSTVGPETLVELRRAWSQADRSIHIHGFFDVQTLGDLAVRAGLAEPVLDVDRINVTYSELSSAIRDLRAMGGTNAAAGRPRGLTGRGRWQRFIEAFWRDQGSGERGRLSLTVELILGQAFGVAPGSRAGPDGDIVVPLSALKR